MNLARNSDFSSLPVEVWGSSGTNTKSSGTQYVSPVNVAGAPYYYTLSKIQFCASQDTSSTANGGLDAGSSS